MDQATTYVFAGGGSGGHLMPGLAIAERLREIAPEVATIFLCSDRPLDRQILKQAGVTFVALPARPAQLRPVVRAPVAFVVGWYRTKRRVRRYLAQRFAGGGLVHIVAMGGYVAAPVVDFAHRAGIRVTMVNLDAVPGRANRFMSRRADRVLSAVSCPNDPSFGEAVGFPIRRCAIADTDPSECRRRVGLKPEVPTLLVTGASQGAGSLNRFMIRLVATHRDALADWQILHLSGSRDQNEVRAAYLEAGVSAVVMPFCETMGDAWGSADLALTRAGANSVAEAQANSVPAVFVPYPFHGDDHQRYNAQPLVDGGCAWLGVDCVDADRNLETIGRVLLPLLTDAGARSSARLCLGKLPRRDGAEAMARILLGESGGSGGSAGS